MICGPLRYSRLTIVQRIVIFYYEALEQLEAKDISSELFVDRAQESWLFSGTGRSHQQYRDRCRSRYLEGAGDLLIRP
jgi:hypothetical protein